ncbi:hypothetical protein EJ03DRAFT_391337 [Teratosphaeria nubilosa]|uniref:PCI domain-containing protein n=1 Tax=Teratosphaeria nubilosa TaxID=161662 RepID=A0A6G1KYQ5_9PEZI|nr:hypothetical protein EJ03DRAFT_391337 [Teratosphaeria nubilosa]
MPTLLLPPRLPPPDNPPPKMRHLAITIAKGETRSHVLAESTPTEIPCTHRRCSYQLRGADLRCCPWIGVCLLSALLPLRLAHIARHCPALARPALALALAAAKRGRDVPLSTRVGRLAARLGCPDLGTPDAAWTARTDAANRRELARMESELRGYKNNLIRESIRMGQEDLASHLLATGGPAPDPANPQAPAGYHAAWQAFGKMRDYCTTPVHVASMNLRLLYTAVLLAVSAQQGGQAAGAHWSAAKLQAGRLKSAGVKEEEQSKLTPIACATAALADLGQGHYRDAAQAFLTTPFEYNGLGPVHGADYGRTVASANDIAVYGGLCALATLTRDRLITQVLGGNFRRFLELEPHVRKAISLFTTAKYQACLDLLRHYYSDWCLDVFLGGPAGGSHTHVDALVARIREKSITAHFSSFSGVSLTSLASTFPPMSSSPTAIEDEVISMIESGRLDARLDVVNGVLVAPRGSARRTTHAEALKAAREVERELLLRLHGVNVVMAGLKVPRALPGGGGLGVKWMVRGRREERRPCEGQHSLIGNVS